MPQSAYTNKLSHFFDLLVQAIKGGEHDYTKGSLRGAIILLAIPMILELSFESIFAVVDIFFVSKLGSEAIQTVGLTESVITIVYSLAIGLSTAATAIKCATSCFSSLGCFSSFLICISTCISSSISSLFFSTSLSFF